MSARFRFASGLGLTEMAAVGVLGASRAAVVLCGPGSPVQIGVRLVVDTLLTGLWRGRDGSVWVVDRDGVVRWSADPWGEPGWHQQELDAVLRGVLGDDRGAVWAWGTRRSDGESVVRRWDGRAWKPLSHPGFPIRAVTDGGRWWVGQDGAVARWRVDHW